MSEHFERQPGLAQPHVLRDYALIADGERGALLGPRGDISWMCFPGWDGDAVFSSLMGGGGGYAVTPKARYVWGGFYEPGTLIWHSRWTTDEQSVIECREALALPAQRDRVILLRRITAVAGIGRVRVALNLRYEFGAAAIRDLKLSDQGEWRGRLGDAHACWTGASRADPNPDGHRGKVLTADLEIEAGEEHDLVLTIDSDEAPEPQDPRQVWQATESAWRERVPRLESTIAPRDARHAYAVVSGLTTGGGGMVAAATTSLPERAREGRNYDYRYVWIRDQCYVGQALARAGGHPLMDDAVRFVCERLLEDRERLSPAYTADGGKVPKQRQLDLRGYPGGSDIIGNWVRDQFQLDAFGEALLLFAAADRHDHLDADGWRAAEIAVEAIEARRKEKGAGVWETEPRHWVHSRLICAAGLRAVAERETAGERASRWSALADAMVADAARDGLSPSGAWQRAPDDSRPDASLLLAAVRGAVPADDPRSLATLEAVEKELTEDGYAYRYRAEGQPLGEAEGAFLLCGFWLSLAWYQQGDRERAGRWFERNRAACGTPGLLSEEFDVRQRQLRGNLPQAFVHGLLLESACAGYEAPGPD